MALSQRYDVAVVGAGPAGVSAAIAASVAGASVLVIDSGKRLGGSVTAAMHRCLCGLYAAAPQSPLDTLNSGVQRDVVARMTRIAPSLVVTRQFGHASVLEFPASAWESSLAQLCSEANVLVHSDSRAVHVGRERNRVTSLQVTGALEGSFQIEALVDCTGGGNLLQLVGEEMLQPVDPDATNMLGGYAIRFGGLGSDTDLLRLQIPYALGLAVSQGSLPPAAKFAVFYPGPGAGEGVLKLAIPPDAFSPEQVEPFAQAVMNQLMDGVSAFATATIIERSPQAMRRDGRRLRGRYTVTESDVLEGRKHGADAVHAWWPIENWDAVKGPTYVYPPAGEYYDIPPEALQSSVMENVFAAGTCISATRAAAASTRAGGICLATGAKAGELAARHCHDRKGLASDRPSSPSPGTPGEGWGGGSSADVHRPKPVPLAKSPHLDPPPEYQEYQGRTEEDPPV